jgi:TrmH family RNA methyltransferase
MKRITSRDNPLVKDLVRLAHSARDRRRDRIALLDGPHLIEAFLGAGRVPRIAVVSETGLDHPEARLLYERCVGAERAVIADRVFAQISGLASPVGILACADVPAPAALPTSIDDAVILDRLQDTGNVGSILRTSAAAGVRTMVGITGTAFFWSPKVLRAGMGAQFYLDLHEHHEVDAVLPRCRGEILAMDADGPDDLYDLDLTGPVAWVFGNEGGGIDPAIAARATRRVRIPMPGEAESLNVAAAAAACLFEQVRQRRGRGKG